MLSPGRANSAVQFYRIVPEAIPPMPADASALGTLPFAAYQYCEAIRTASSFGWYIFPMDDIHLRWDGAEARYSDGGEWQFLDSLSLAGDSLERWNRYAPDNLKDRPPPYLSNLFVPGLVQVWSGLLIGSDANWSIHVRPPANLVQSPAYACYEAIIETDQFRPCPLFINLRLIATDREIVLPRTKPLFQVQPVPRGSYAGPGKTFDVIDIADMTDDDWDGVGDTVRSSDPSDPDHRIGSYAARTRRRARQESE
jgi:hypothetical protein